MHKLEIEIDGNAVERELPGDDEEFMDDFEQDNDRHEEMSETLREKTASQSLSCAGAIAVLGDTGDQNVSLHDILSHR